VCRKVLVVWVEEAQVAPQPELMPELLEQLIQVAVVVV
jgi:hypothetical protein